MAEGAFILEIKTETLRHADGLIGGLRVTSSNAPGLVDIWLWLDRDTDRLDELRLYRARTCDG